MPLLKSAIKKMRADKKRATRNRRQRDNLHDAVKAVEKTVAKKGDAAATLKTAYSKIDKAAKNFLIHKNTAANWKSRLARLVKKTVAGK